MSDPLPRAPSSDRGERRCDGCGRVVRETMHARAGYTVDAYVLYTGDTEPAVVRRPESDVVALAYARLTRPVILVTCADCYATPRGRRRHQSFTFPLPDDD
jgi:hypothetical protein